MRAHRHHSVGFNHDTIRPTAIAELEAWLSGPTAGLKPIDMEAHRLANLGLDRLHRFADRDTAWKIRRISRIIYIRLFDHDRVTLDDRIRSMPGCEKP